MKIKFYGTGAYEGVPALFCECGICKSAKDAGGKNIRTRSQSLVDGELLIDFPADTYMHALYGGLPLSSIRHCIITHGHSDHFYPEDLSTRGVAFAHGELGCLTVYGTNKVVSRITVSDRVNIMHIEPFKPFNAAGYKITPLAADHSADTGPVIYIIEKGGKALLYANDTGYFPPETWQYIENTRPKLNFASFDCTCAGPIRRDHMSLSVVAEARDRLKALGCIDENTVCCINHFSHNNGLTHEQIAEKARPLGLVTAYDGLEIEF